MPAGGPIDVSVSIRPRMPIYPGDPGVAITLAKSIVRGDPANVSRLDIGAHTGTHVDAPCHFIPDGADASELPLDRLIGPCVVADLTRVTAPIDAAAVDAIRLPPGGGRVLLKTPNSRLWTRDAFTREFARLDASGAAALIAHDVSLIGIDYLSVGDRDAHLALLEHGVTVIEGL